MKVLLKKLEARLRPLSPLTITAIALGWVLACGVADYYTPSTLTVTPFYFLAVILAGWGAGRWHACLVSAVAAFSAFTVCWLLERGVPHPAWIAAWNNSTRFLMFSLTGWITAELTRMTRTLERQVEERTARWKDEAERHQGTATRLAEALERFEQVITNIAEVFWLTNVAKSEMVYISPGYERIWGRLCEELYRTPGSWLAAVYPADREAVARRSFTEQAVGSYDVEYRIVRPDGAVRWIRDRAFPVRNERGEVYRVAGIAEDITERKQARETLQMQAAILENMAEGVVVTDQTGAVVQMNPAAERIWGYGRDEVLGRSASLFSALPKAEAEAVLQEVLRELETTGTWRGTFRNRRRDGALISCEAVINRLENHGRALMVAVEQDVTERLKAQEQLQLQALVLESVAEAVVMFNEEGTIVLTNPAADALLGYDKGELRGRSLGVVSGEVNRQFQQEMARSVAEVKLRGTAAGNYIARRKDGTLIEVGTHSSGVRIGGRLFIVVVGQDVTHRQQAARALARSEELYRTLFELSPDGILLEDTRGNILDANQALCRVFGYSPEELLGRNVRCFALPEDQERVETHLGLLRAGKALEHEVWNLRKDGQRCLMRLNEKTLALPEGRQGILVVARDITSAKRAEVTKEAFLSLGRALSAAGNPVEAARAIYATADLFWKWDAASLDLYSLKSDRIEPVLNCDVVAGQRREVAPGRPGAPPTPRMRRILEKGAELIGDDPVTGHDEFAMFGDTSRRSASMMYVPLRCEAEPVGIVSIHSYSAKAYTPEDLRTLQALADYCGGALDRLRAEAARRQSEEMNRAILATAMEGFLALDFAVDPRGAITDVNDAYCSMTGYRREELLRMRLTDVEAQESPEEVGRHKERILAGRGDRFETRHRRKDGGDIQVEISACRLPGRDQWIFDFVRDITERKRAELRQEAFLSLGTRLSAARTPVEAARAIYAVADSLWQWDSATLHVYSPETDLVQEVINYDLLDGERRELPAQEAWSPVTPRIRRIIREGPELILRDPTAVPTTDSVMIGNVTRYSASLMCVPIRQEGKPVGVLSVQSYSWNAYTAADLQTLRALADHCGGAFERIRAETALRASEEQLRAFYDSPGGFRGVLELLEDEMLIVSANAPLAAAYGRSVEGMRHVCASDLGVPRPVRDLWRASLRESLTAGGPVTFEYPTDFRAPGTWAMATVCPLAAGPGAPPRFAFLSANITERKLAEQRLKDALDLNQKMLAAATLGICAYRASGECMFANEALVGIVGGSLEEVLQGNFRQIAAWRESGLVEMADEALSVGQAVSREVFCQTRFGKKIWLDCHMTAFLSNGQPHVLLMAKDVSERKQTEQALKMHSLVLQSMSEGVLLLDPDQTILFANPALEAMFGYERGELLGAKADLLNAPSRRETSSFNELATHEMTGGRTWSGECQNRRKDGTLFASEARMSALELNGRTHWVSVQQDITERKRAERLQKTILDNIPDPAWLKDTHGRFLACNQALARYYGQPVERIIGHTVFEVVPTEAKRMAEEDEDVMRTRRSVISEAAIPNPESGVRWFESIKSPLCNERDEVVGTVGIARDITERKQNMAVLLAQRDLGVSLSMTSGLGTALKHLLDASLQLAGMDAGGTHLVNERTGGMDLIVHHGVSPGFVKAMSHWAADSPRVRLVEQGKPVFNSYRGLPFPLADAREREGFKATALVPLCHEGKAIGALGLSSRHQDEVPRQTQLVLEALAAQAAGAIARIRAEAEQHRLERQLLEITDREQARIGQDIHDGLCQHLVSLAFDANSLARALSRQQGAQARTAHRLAELADQAITETRQLARGLFPVRLASDGLPSALEELARTTTDRFKVQCRFRTRGKVTVSNSTIATHLYRIAQEAVANAVKHSQARVIAIDLTAQDEQLRLDVKDNGRGFHPKPPRQPGGMGLHIMDYRARSIGGTLRVANRVRGGTQVFCCVPRPIG